MPEARCTTCRQVLTQCACPPPLPDTLGRVAQLQTDRRMCLWSAGRSAEPTRPYHARLGRCRNGPRPRRR